MEVRCKATVYFYDDPHEKPEVILEGSWGGREIVKAGALLTKAYRKHIRDLAREGKLTAEVATKAELDATRELEDGELETPTINQEEKSDE